MKKIILPLLLLVTLASCKKDGDKVDQKLADLIAAKDIKGIQAYKERQKFKMDSINNVMAQIDKNLKALGVSPLASGVVSVVKMESSNFVHSVDIQGNVTTDQDVMVQPQFSGMLTLFVKEGQNVSRGQVIGRVSDGGLNDQYQQAKIQVTTVQAQLQQVKSSANLAKITFEKQSALWKQKIGSEFQYLQAKTNYESAQKQVAAAQSQVSATQKAADAVKTSLARTAITAPFSGVVDQVVTQNGQVVSPGTNIVKLISLGQMKIQADVPENYLAKVKVGTPVKVFIPTLNKTISSSIKLVGNFINPDNRTFKIEIPVSGQTGVKPNLLAQVQIQDYINPNSLQVPAQYVYEDGEKKSYVVIANNINGEDGIAKRVYVQLGEQSQNAVEITTGLKTGDMVITDGSKNLTDGQKVKISN
ncbi:efflux RND transporter periplasmic adaptor subunit [Frigoriflavimonas asaccharolytica]|uniref:RND family efflux transporter MFP subunit n=1 Tax=Frigoriflavimonas asaccharolytica TaxID=2735899 RepID=A0A8J8K5S6_9FLAO|nr:efflux RND transporter periplasmic adaptor subunit [Frigoriflavimonas asaccharolytica]NRS93000.1 RND family efflux transporter MFP subunit [Frigoriflavimonas asaccharolytica]